MPDKKQSCKTCKTRHLPPTGKKCQFKSTVDSDKSVPNGLRDAAVSSKLLDTDQADLGGQRLQLEILSQLKKVSQRLDMVEDQVAGGVQQATQASVGSPSPATGKLSTDSVIVSSQKSKRSKKFKPPVESSTSSSDDSDSDIPSLDKLRSHGLQKKVDRRIRDLDQSSHLSGSDSKLKHKSKRGGNVDVSVKRKVSWPHEPILGGVSRQRVTYDQLSLTQWVQGFCKNILEQKSSDRRDIMVSYLSDLMEDATDFSWQGAKAAHAVLLCEMERGSLQWEDLDRIDRIRRAHAQKHVSGRSGWAKPLDHSSRKPWYCKNYQFGTCVHSRDHESNGKIHKHVCSFCLAGGRQVGHPEKECPHKKSSKNEQAAAHH